MTRDRVIYTLWQTYENRGRALGRSAYPYRRFLLLLPGGAFCWRDEDRRPARSRKLRPGPGSKPCNAPSPRRPCFRREGEKEAAAMPILAGEGGEPIARSRKFYLAIEVPRERRAEREPPAA